MALIWLSQLTTIYSCYDNGLTKKTEEIYIRNFHMKCRKRIVELNESYSRILVTVWGQAAA